MTDTYTMTFQISKPYVPKHLQQAAKQPAQPKRRPHFQIGRYCRDEPEEPEVDVSNHVTLRIRLESEPVIKDVPGLTKVPIRGRRTTKDLFGCINEYLKHQAHVGLTTNGPFEETIVFPNKSMINWHIQACIDRLHMRGMTNVEADY